jgi:hypothetical protein
MAAQLSLSDVHWKAPCTILVTYLAGLIFAIGHHLFYVSLDGKVVDAENRHFGQQINIAIGTAFAFLVRASLIGTIGATYWQVFWGKILREGKSLPLAHLDSLAGLLGSVYEFSNVQAISRNQGLALLAVLSWLVPLATLLPPATLAVENMLQIRHTSVDVPIINFTSTALMAAGSITNSEFVPGAASSRLLQLANSVAMESKILDLPGVGINTTYELQFPGPAVQCRPLPESYLGNFRNYMDHDCTGYSFNATTFSSSSPNEVKEIEYCGLDKLSLTYMSWMTHDNPMTDMRPPWEVKGDSMQPTFTPIGYSRSMIVATRRLNPVVAKGSDMFDMIYEPWNVLNCSLHHAIYTANISSSASNVSKVVDFNVEFLSAVARTPIVRRTSVSSGYTEDVPPSTLPGATTNGYTAMIGGVSSILGGFIRDRGRGKPNIQTGFRTSALMYTRELMQNTAINLTSPGLAWWALTDSERASNSPYPEEAFAATTFNESLGTAIELLFQRTTLSLLSKPLFVQDSGQPTNAIIQAWPNFYTYRPKHLLISYGVALTLTTLVCGIGFATIHRNEASYSNSFSTILRTTRGHLESFDTLLVDRDQRGADPLPPHLAEAHVQLGQARPDRQRDDNGGLPSQVPRTTSRITRERSSAIERRGEDRIKRERGKVELVRPGSATTNPTFCS